MKPPVAIPEAVLQGNIPVLHVHRTSSALAVGMPLFPDNNGSHLLCFDFSCLRWPLQYSRNPSSDLQNFLWVVHSFPVPFPGHLDALTFLISHSASSACPVGWRLMVRTGVLGWALLVCRSSLQDLSLLIPALGILKSLFHVFCLAFCSMLSWTASPQIMTWRHIIN